MRNGKTNRKKLWEHSGHPGSCAFLPLPARERRKKNVTIMFKWFVASVSKISRHHSRNRIHSFDLNINFDKIQFGMNREPIELISQWKLDHFPVKTSNIGYRTMSSFRVCQIAPEVLGIFTSDEVSEYLLIGKLSQKTIGSTQIAPQKT